MIPKIIHYCWFGRKPLPKSAIKCLESWRKFFPDYEIKEWNEDNFDVYQTRYTAQAYQAGKYAFVSDFARFKILYEQGGIYFDTDVEVVKSFDDILQKRSFMGMESCFPILYINPGLGMGCESQHPIFQEILKIYENLEFYLPDGTQNSYAVVKITTDVLTQYNLKQNKEIQTIQGINVYPPDFFNPLNDCTGKLCLSKNTLSIHWFAKSWMNVSPLRIKMGRIFHRLMGL